MRRLLRTAFAPEGPVDRRTYLTIGATLMAAKYVIDALFIYTVTGQTWTPFDYLGPLVSLRRAPPTALTDLAGVALVLRTLPFIWIGVVMSARRAADAGLPAWLSVAFFVPILNYVLILILSIVPTANRGDAGRPRIERGDGPLFDRQAAIAVLSGVACACVMIVVGVVTLQVYGLTLFLGAPFMLGLVTGSLANLERSRGVPGNAALVTLAVLIAGAALIGFALEGAVCVVMAIPIALPMAFAGGFVGERIAAHRRLLKGGIAMLLLLSPAGSIADRARDRPETRMVMTSIEIDAPPQRVWRHVVEFDEITAPPEWYFRAGLAYPLRARIDGHGAGALRHCEFTTGAFVEPISEWDEPVRLAFDVASQPPPLQDWSPYSHVSAPHLNGYFTTTHGEFRLVPLDGGRTRLEGRTWYSLRMAPAFYWNPIADGILHRIHQRVLRHIRQQT